MKTKKIILIVTACVALLIGSYWVISHNRIRQDENKSSYFLPKVLFLTTGSTEGNGTLAQGVVIAMQTFNKQGAIVRLESRNILLDTAKLGEFNIMILPTSIDYHDADKKYSLTFLSDEEMLNIKNWIKKGGVLIAGDNTGRNKLDNTDRINLLQELTPSNWPLGECFGISLSEKNIQGYHIEGKIDTTLQGVFIPEQQEEQWVLATDSVYSTSLKALASWTNGNKKIPALIENEFGKGISFLLPSFYLLHPANDGGYWSPEKIQHFYEYVLAEFYKKRIHKIQVNPWPAAHDYAFCLTLNAAGDEHQFERMFSFLQQEKISPTFFVNGGVKTDIQKLMTDKAFCIQSNGFNPGNYRQPYYPLLMQDLLFNQTHWKKNFTGFRFPFTRTSFWGMMSLNDAGFEFDSSIGADNLEAYNGSVFPYNIPVSNDSYYKTLQLLEISPALNDDYHFYKNLVESPAEIQDQQSKDALLFEKYLSNFWQYAVKPYNGMMVFIGHPIYTGFSDTTMIPLKNLIKQIKSENTWITTIEELSNYWSALGKFHFEIHENSTQITIHVDGPKDAVLKEMTFRLFQKPIAIQIKDGTYQLIEKGEKIYLITDAFPGQELVISY